MPDDLRNKWLWPNVRFPGNLYSFGARHFYQINSGSLGNEHGLWYLGVKLEGGGTEDCASTRLEHKPSKEEREQIFLVLESLVLLRQKM